MMRAQEKAPPLPPTPPSQDLDPGKAMSADVEELSDSEGLYAHADASTAASSAPGGRARSAAAAPHANSAGPSECLLHSTRPPCYAVPA